MRTARVRNLTSHSLWLQAFDRTVTFHPREDKPVRVIARQPDAPCEGANGIPTLGVHPGTITGLPAPEESVIVLVDLACLQHPEVRTRGDVFAPDQYLRMATQQNAMGCVYGVLRRGLEVPTR